MKSKVIIAILILIVILTHCKKIEKVPGRAINIDENRTSAVSFKLYKRIKLSNILYPKIAISAGNEKIYVYGKYTSSAQKKFIVKIFDKELEFISQKPFHYGQGPGDVGLTNIITHCKENIYISENSNLRVSIYDSDFKYIKSVKYNENATYPFEMIEDGRFFVASKLVYDQKDKEAYSFRIVIFPEIKVKKFFTTDPYFPYDEKHRFLLGEDTEYYYFYKNKYIYLLLSKKYQILKFDLNGAKIDDLTVKVNVINTPKELTKQFLESQGYLNRNHKFGFSKNVTPTSVMIPLEKGFIVVRRKDYFTKCNGLVDGDYFSYQLEYSGKVKLPCFCDIYKITGGMLVFSFKYNNNFLYLVNELDEDFFLEKWEVIE